MANTSSSANMSLPIPVVGTQSGPQYAININDCLTIIDQHTHTPGSGVSITSAALNINADLSIGGNNLTSVKSVRMSPQSTTLVGASDLGCIYEVNDDLYYNDANGTAIRITQNGAVAGTPGSIANLASPASASYVSASSKFVFQSDVNTPAYVDGASILIRNLTASSKALTLEAPAAMGADFTLTLPSLPGSKKIMTLTSAGAMAADYDVDNSSLEVASNLLRIKAGGVTAAMLASGVLKDIVSAAFSSTSTWTCPAGVTSIMVYGSGAGGGGGGGSNNGGASTAGIGGKGGTAGQAGLFPLTVVPGTIYTVTIGAGGTAGAVNSGNGGAGGASSIGSISFAGGRGGYGGAFTFTATGSNNMMFGEPGASGVGGAGGRGDNNATGGGTGAAGAGGGGGYGSLAGNNGSTAGGAGGPGYIVLYYLG